MSLSDDMYEGDLYHKHRNYKMKISNDFRFVMMYMIHGISADVELDKEHLELYPFCGKLFGYEWHDATSRVVNSKESEIQYPWVVYLRHSILVKDISSDNTRKIKKMCSGTVIGER